MYCNEAAKLFLLGEIMRNVTYLDYTDIAVSHLSPKFVEKGRKMTLAQDSGYSFFTRFSRPFV